MSNVLYMKQLKEIEQIERDDYNKDHVRTCLFLAKTIPYPHNKYWLYEVRKHIKGSRRATKKAA